MLKKIVAFGLGMAAAVSLAGCAGNSGGPAGESTAQAYHKIDAAEAKEMMDGEIMTVVDVRTPEEYAEGHVPGAINIPNEDIGDEEPELLPDKDAVVLVYCRSGRRSKEAADKLVEMDYRNVYDFGGIMDWPYETVSP